MQNKYLRRYYNTVREWEEEINEIKLKEGGGEENLEQLNKPGSLYKRIAY